MSRGKTIPLALTVGHSTRTAEQLLELLQEHGASLIADVRKMPRSGRNPQFNAQTLSAELEQAGIGYLHLPGLGGLRRPSPDSANAGWRNASFRGYADYMQTAQFRESLEEILRLTEDGPPCLMCAEAVPWRCHRRLIADALLARGISVEHILDASRSQTHTLTPWAKIEPGAETPIYPPE